MSFDVGSFGQGSPKNCRGPTDRRHPISVATVGNNPPCWQLILPLVITLQLTTMSAHAARLARLFTPEYARRINAQIVYPARSVVVKPNELESALTRPLHVAVYEPDRPAAYLAATLSYGIIKGISFCTYAICFCLPIPRTSIPGR